MWFGIITLWIRKLVAREHPKCSLCRSADRWESTCMARETQKAPKQTSPDGVIPTLGNHTAGNRARFPGLLERCRCW